MLRNHVALWSCPRSRSTALARSFEQRDDCVVFDEPLYPAYAKIVEYDNPYRDEIMAAYECDFTKIVARLSAPLPAGKLAVQKHITRNILPEFGTSWYPEKNVFLLRDPHEIVASLYRIRGPYLGPEHVGMSSLYRIFLQVHELSGSKPLVIHSDDLANRPRKVLTQICDELCIPFSESMLQWSAGLAGSNLGLRAIASARDVWYDSVKRSTGFCSKKKMHPVPTGLLWIAEECQPIYRKLLTHCERLL